MKEDDRLKVLQASREFRDRVLAVLTHLPKRETLGLRSQLADAARSVSSNISEALGRGTRAEELQFFRLANGSLEEAPEGLRELVNTGLISRQTFSRLWNLSVAISKMLSKLISKRERG